MFSEMVTSFCTVLALQKGCQQTFIAAGRQTNISEQLDGLQNEFLKDTQKEAYHLLGKETVEYSFKAGLLAKSIANHEVTFQTPIKLMNCNLEFDSKILENYSLKLKWELP